MVIILISEVGLTVCAVNLTRARSECPRWPWWRWTLG